jgi:lauroyl/myristoyl acyltransferase
LRAQNLFSLNMDTLLCWPVRALVALLQALPLTVVARLGRAGGGLAYWLDARHRRVALKNLTMCFGTEKSPDEIRALARENFRCIGENFVSAVKTAAMTFDELRPHLEFAHTERLQPPRRIVVAIGHFGNFELYARFHQFSPGYQCATTYRALKHPAFDQLLQDLRGRSGCLYFERRTDGPLLRTAMAQPGIILGLLADQSTPGLRGPFFGQDCSSTLAPAVFALRYQCELYTAFCFRVGPARWRIELGESVPTRENGRPRSSEDIMSEVNRAFEAAVRRDPANWFWVHNRWKPASSRARRREARGENAHPAG